MDATYRLSVADRDAASELAEAIAREQTVEVPPGVGGVPLQEALLGRILAVESIADGCFDATIRYPLAVTGTELPQLLNVLYGNVSLMNGVQLVEVEPSEAVLAALPGPRLGIDGLRRRVAAEGGRPLVAVAIKPVGLSTGRLAELAADFAVGGADVIKDDHGLVDQPSSRFEPRVEAVAAAVDEVNQSEGRRCLYFPNVTGPIDGLERRVAHARAAGCGGVMICPSLMGLDAMRSIAAAEEEIAVMAHPAHGQSAPGRSVGMTPEVLFGTLYRLAGADIVVYVNAEGRFSWPVETCHAINARLRAPLGGHRRAFPAPAGGVDAARAERWLRAYGPNTMLLIGGSLLARPDVRAATRELVGVAEANAP